MKKYAVEAGSAKAPLTLGRGWFWVALVALIAAPLFLKSFFVFQLTMLLVYSLAVLALNVLTGSSGQFSLGQNAFFGVGAYVTAVLIESAQLHYAGALLSAAVLCFIFGFAFAMPALRLSGVYLALATFALGIATPQVLKLHFLEPWTGGVQGLVVTKPNAPFGLPLNQDQWFYYVTLALALAVFLATVNIMRSRTGFAFMAVRDHEVAASAMGIDVAVYKTLAFGLSAGITGLAGGLSALAIQFVAPDAYAISLAISLFLGMVIGGVGWLPGSIVGAAFIIFVPNVAESISKGLSGAVFGVLLFVIIFAAPRGAKQVVDIVAQRVRRLRLRDE